MNKREVTAQYVPPKVFRVQPLIPMLMSACSQLLSQVQEYATKGWQFTLARKELQAYAFLCRQQEAREWLEATFRAQLPSYSQSKLT